MANPSWDGIVTYAKYTVAAGAVDAKHTTSFNIPLDASVITFITPDMATDTSAALEGLSPFDKTTWTAVSAYDPAAPAHKPVVINESAYVVVPAWAIGTGTFRFVNVTDQTTTTPIVVIVDRA